MYHYYNLSDLKRAIDEYIEYYNNKRYNELLDNWTPASVYNTTNKKILEQRQILKQKSMRHRRKNHLRYKSTNIL